MIFSFSPIFSYCFLNPLIFSVSPVLALFAVVPDLFSLSLILVVPGLFLEVYHLCCSIIHHMLCHSVIDFRKSCSMIFNLSTKWQVFCSIYTCLPGKLSFANLSLSLARLFTNEVIFESNE